MEPGTRVMAPDGRVGNVKVTQDDGKILVTLPFERPKHEVVEDHPETTRIVAGLEDVTFDSSELKLKWVEGPDQHSRYFDQDGNQVLEP